MKGAKWRFGFCALRLANFSFKSASPMTEAIPPTSSRPKKVFYTDPDGCRPN